MRTESYTNVFDALEDDHVTARNLYIRGQLMMAITKHLNQLKLTQKEAAKKMGVTQPRISDLKRGKIDLFTIDMLISMLEKTGIEVFFSLKDAA